RSRSEASEPSGGRPTTLMGAGSSLPGASEKLPTTVTRNREASACARADRTMRVGHEVSSPPAQSRSGAGKAGWTRCPHISRERVPRTPAGNTAWGKRADFGSIALVYKGRDGGRKI